MLEPVSRLLPLSLLGVLLAGALAVTLRLYRRDRRAVGRRAGALLAGLRCLLAGLLVLAAGGLVLAGRRERLEKPRLLVAIDGSRSFLLAEPHRPESQIAREATSLGRPPEEVRVAPRWELARLALASGWLDTLRARFRVELASVGGALEPYREGTPPGSGQSDFLEPLGEKIASEPGEKPAGVLLLTDGHWRGPGERGTALSQLASSGVPVHGVGVGAETLPPDLELAPLEGPSLALVGDEIKLQVVLHSRSLPALRVAVKMLDGATELAAAEVEVPGDGSPGRGVLSFKAAQAGRRSWTVTAAPAPGEVLLENNTRSLRLDVIDGKVRVLLLHGSSRWEERYLRSSWGRDSNVELTSFLASPPPERRLPQDAPRSAEGLFSFDVLVLGDLEPALFARSELEVLRDYVQARGGTLVLLAGERSLPYRWAGTPLEECFPVTLIEPAPPVSAGSTLAGDGVAFELTPTGESAELTRLVPGRERNLELWRRLPGPRWVAPVAGVRQGGEALVRAAGQPVVVTRGHGAGKVLWVGCDATWKWRYKLGDELHRRFWGQVVRWGVAQRLGAPGSGGQAIVTNKPSYAPGERVVVTALLPASGDRSEANGLEGTIERLQDGKKSSFRLESVPRSGGRAAATLDLAALQLAPGPGAPPADYRIRLGSDASAGSPGGETHLTALASPDPELEDFGCNRAFLDEVARATGGTSLPLASLRDAGAGIPDRPLRTTEPLEWTLLDSPTLTAALLLGGLALEWALRKRWDLI